MSALLFDMNYLFYVYIKGTFITNLYQLVLSKAYTPVSCANYLYSMYNITFLVGNDSLVYDVSVRSKTCKEAFSVFSSLSSCLHL